MPHTAKLKLKSKPAILLGTESVQRHVPYLDHCRQFESR